MQNLRTKNVLKKHISVVTIIKPAPIRGIMNL